MTSTLQFTPTRIPLIRPRLKLSPITTPTLRAARHDRSPFSRNSPPRPWPALGAPRGWRRPTGGIAEPGQTSVVRITVRVTARTVDGQATAAALAAVAGAFGVRRHAVTLVAGTASRTKIIEVAGAD